MTARTILDPIPEHPSIPRVSGRGSPSLRFWDALLLVAILTHTSIASAAAGNKPDAPSVKWETDYASTMDAAERQGLTMVVYFGEEGNTLCSRFDKEVASSPDTIWRLSQCSCVRLPLDAEIISGGETIRLLEHPAFANLQGGPGLVFFDFAGASAAPGGVLRTLPFRADQRLETLDFEFLGDRPIVEPAPVGPLEWMSDYALAMAKAETEERMLLIYFENPDGSGGCAQFEAETLSQAKVCEGLKSYVCLKLACGAGVNIEGAETVLLRHRSFQEMVGLPGIAMVDFTDSEDSYYGQVVSTFPFLGGKAYEPFQMDVILNLPPGELTQRTLIYAVRTHPDAPRSTSGELDLYLVSEAESHSVHQARIRLQGHHSWESRFHKINRRLPGGLLASEVCAESWPGQNLLEAAIDCVHCWRQSSGHWRSVKAAHPVFGYDIRRGSNGIWYATGIFGKRGH